MFGRSGQNYSNNAEFGRLKIFNWKFVSRQVPVEEEQHHDTAVLSRSSTKAVVITVVQERTTVGHGAPWRTTTIETESGATVLASVKTRQFSLKDIFILHTNHIDLILRNFIFLNVFYFIFVLQVDVNLSSRSNLLSVLQEVSPVVTLFCSLLRV